jgi:hypothetical protein
MREYRVGTVCNFPDALRLVQSGCQVRRAGWDPSLLYVSWNTELDRVDLVREGRDGEGPFCFAEPWLGGAAIGGPPLADCVAEDWTVVEDPRVPTEEGGERAQAAELAAIDAEGEEAGPAPGAAGCGAWR